MTGIDSAKIGERAKAAKLRTLALAATPGPWVAHEPAGKDPRYGVTAGRHYDPSAGASRRIAWCGSPYHNRGTALAEEDYANARLIAELNPLRVIALLDTMAEARKALEPFAMLADCINNADDEWPDSTKTALGNAGKLRAAKSALAHIDALTAGEG